MSSTASWLTFVSSGLLALTGCVSQPASQPEPPPAARTLLFQEDFKSTDNWIVECERSARVVTLNGVLEIDTPAGCSVWFKWLLEGSLEIEFDATAVAAGGANDEVSDLNVFWMATNRDGTSPLSTPRSGKFADYNDLLTYYVGLGGNRNSTTRFRRYIGDPEQRPLLPEHDLSTPDVLLVPNQKQTIVLVANRNTIEYRRDGRTLFHLDDERPYTQGWFALRTTQSHLRIQRLRIYSLEPR
jgi:hypothetical protein